MMRRQCPWIAGFVWALCALAAIQTASSQEVAEVSSKPIVTVEHYELAETRMRHNIFRMVKNLFVVPHWIGQTDRFWYARQTAQGIEYVIVDAATGDRHPAFNHEVLARVLSTPDAPVGPENLGISELDFDDASQLISFDWRGNRYRIDWEREAVEETEPDAPEGFIVSPDKRYGLGGQDGNLVLRDLESGEEVQLTTDGTPDNGYGVYYGNWKAAYIPRLRSGQRQPPLGCSWAPDSRHILALKLDQSHVAPYPFLETVPDDGTFRPKVHLPRIPLTGEEPAKSEWYILDIEQRTRQKLLLPYEDLFHVHQDMLAIRKVQWSSDCQRLYAVTWGDNLASAQLFDVDGASGSARVVVQDRIGPRTDLNTTSYNPPNVYVVGDCDEVIWFSQRDGWGHLYLYDGRTGDLKNQITNGPWLVRDLIHVDESKADDSVYRMRARGRRSLSPLPVSGQLRWYRFEATDTRTGGSHDHWTGKRRLIDRRSSGVPGGIPQRTVRRVQLLDDQHSDPIGHPPRRRRKPGCRVRTGGRVATVRQRLGGSGGVRGHGGRRDDEAVRRALQTHRI
jgi:hypothetical protein